MPTRRDSDDQSFDPLGSVMDLGGKIGSNIVNKVVKEVNYRNNNVAKRKESYEPHDPNSSGSANSTDSSFWNCVVVLIVLFMTPTMLSWIYDVSTSIASGRAIAPFQTVASVDAMIPLSLESIDASGFAFFTIGTYSVVCSELTGTRAEFSEDDFPGMITDEVPIVFDTISLIFSPAVETSWQMDGKASVFGSDAREGGYYLTIRGLSDPNTYNRYYIGMDGLYNIETGEYLENNRLLIEDIKRAGFMDSDTKIIKLDIEWEMTDKLAQQYYSSEYGYRQRFNCVFPNGDLYVGFNESAK